MDGLEEKLGSVLSNPQLMQQIMSMAQTLGNTSTAPAAPPPPTPAPAPEFDIGMLQKLSGLAGQAGADRNQQALLKALDPYLGKDRLIRLEKAMRAAKMAKLAGSLLGSGLLSQTGR